MWPALQSCIPWRRGWNPSRQDRDREPVSPAWARGSSGRQHRRGIRCVSRANALRVSSFLPRVGGEEEKSPARSRRAGRVAHHVDRDDALAIGEIRSRSPAIADPPCRPGRRRGARGVDPAHAGSAIEDPARSCSGKPTIFAAMSRCRCARGARRNRAVRPGTRRAAARSLTLHPSSRGSCRTMIPDTGGS